MHPAGALGNSSLPEQDVRIPGDTRGVGAKVPTTKVFVHDESEERRKLSAAHDERYAKFIGEERYQEFLQQCAREDRQKRLKARRVDRSNAPKPTTTPDEIEKQGAFEDVCRPIMAWIAEKKEKYGWFIGAAFALLVMGALFVLGYRMMHEEKEVREVQARTTRSRSDKADLVYGYFRDKNIDLRDIIAYSTNTLENGRPRRVIVTGLSEDEPEARERFEKDLAAATQPPMFFLRSTGSVIRPLVKPGQAFYALSRECRGGDGHAFRREVQADLALEDHITQEVFTKEESDRDDPEQIEKILKDLREESPELADALKPTLETFGPAYVNEPKLMRTVRSALDTIKGMISSPTPSGVETLKAAWKEDGFDQLEKQISLTAPLHQLLQLYRGNDSKLIGSVSKVNGGLLAPKHFLPTLTSTNIYLLGSNGVSNFTETFRIASDPESIKHLPIGDDLIWIPLSELHPALRKQLGCFKEIRLATREDYKRADHFRYVGWDPRNKNVLPRNTELMRSAVTEEAFDGPRPRFAVHIPGFRGGCGGLLVACDKNDTSFAVCGIHVEGLVNGNPPLYCQPVFADMVPENKDLGTLPFRY